MIYLRDVMNDYLKFITHERGFAQSTIYGYTSWLKHLHTWMVGIGYPEPTVEAFNPAVLRRFLYYCQQERKHRPRTVHGAFLPIGGLSRFLVDNRIVSESPMASIQLPKKDAARRLTVSDEEVRALLAACELQRNPRQIALARCIVQVLCYGALRRQELLDLQVSDVTLSEGKILVRMGKGQKSRSIFVPPSTSAAIAEWLSFRAEDCRHPYLLALDRGRRIQGMGLMAALNAVKSAAGLQNAANVMPHSLRHWRATDLLRSGASLHQIMTFLGHSSLSITQMYLHSSEEDCREIASLSRVQPEPVKPTDDNRRLPKSEKRRRIPRR